MNKYAAIVVDHEAIISALADVYPKTMSITSLQIKFHAGKPKIESALMLLAAQGRVKTAAFNTVATVYRLSEDEAVLHGFKRENPVRNNYELLTTRPAYIPPRMAYVRPEAGQAVEVMSRRGDEFVPFKPPIHMGSRIPGGMA